MVRDRQQPPAAGPGLTRGFRFVANPGPPGPSPPDAHNNFPRPGGLDILWSDLPLAIIALTTMSNQFYVRRGQRQQGPVSKDRVIAAFKDGSIRPTDEIASSPHGPWRPVGEALGRRMTEVPVIEAFTLKKSLFGGRYVAAYQCIHCRASLQSDESEWTGTETCPTCGKRYRISPRAAQQADAERRRLLSERAAHDAAVAKKRAATQAAREAAAARRAAETRLLAEHQHQQDTARQAAEAQMIQAAIAVRRRPGACWYCGQPCGRERPQCPFCMMLVFRTLNGQSQQN